MRLVRLASLSAAAALAACVGAVDGAPDELESGATPTAAGSQRPAPPSGSGIAPTPGGGPTSGGAQGAKTGASAAAPAGGGALDLAPLRRLNRTEYDNAVRDLFGVTTGPARGWVNEPHLSGFDNDAAGQVPNLVQVEQFLSGAEEVAADVVKRIDKIFPCDTKARGDRGCGEAFIEHFGLRAYLS